VATDGEIGLQAKDTSEKVDSFTFTFTFRFRFRFRWGALDERAWVEAIFFKMTEQAASSRPPYRWMTLGSKP
jgi:hypothetical protein